MRISDWSSDVCASDLAAVVVPDGTLFGDGVAARIKEDLATRFRLHTVVRLAKGVFAPYTDIATNILLFEVGGPTKDVWYYERSEERSVGKECLSTCRYRCSPYP